MLFKKIILLIFGLVITIYALYNIAKPIYLMFTGVSAKGVVFALGKKDGSVVNKKRGNVEKVLFNGGQKAKIHFLPYNSIDSITCITNGGIFGTNYTIGEEVTVYYNQQNAHNNSVLNLTEISTYLPILLLGLLILLVVLKSKK